MLFTLSLRSPTLSPPPRGPLVFLTHLSNCCRFTSHFPLCLWITSLINSERNRERKSFSWAASTKEVVLWVEADVRVCVLQTWGMWLFMCNCAHTYTHTHTRSTRSTHAAHVLYMYYHMCMATSPPTTCRSPTAIFIFRGCLSLWTNTLVCQRTFSWGSTAHC